MAKKKDPRLARVGVSGYNKPKRTPNHPTKSHVVVAKGKGCENGKVIRPGIFNKILFANISLSSIWIFFIRYVCPLVIILMLVFQVSE